MNICIHRQIFLWDVKRQKNDTMMLKVSVNGFKHLREVARKTRSRVRIVKKRGLPFVFHRYRRRKAFLLGALAFVVLLYVMTSFIWAVEVTGNKRIETQTIVQQLASHGIRPGIFKFNVDTGKIITDIMLENRDIAWIGISVKGTKVKVDVVERVKPPEFIPKDTPCNLVAFKDGVVKSVVAKTGIQMVKAGDTVSKGDVLVSGLITSENKEVPAKKVHVIGTVLGRTWYEKTCPVETLIREKEKTGKEKSRYSLVLFSKMLHLFRNKEAYQDYEKEEKRKDLSLGKDILLPFGMVTEKYYELKTVEKELTLEEAKNRAAEISYREALEQIPPGAEIVDTKQKFRENEDGSLTAESIIECVEDIGVLETIGGE